MYSSRSKQVLMYRIQTLTHFSVLFPPNVRVFLKNFLLANALLSAVTLRDGVHVNSGHVTNSADSPTLIGQRLTRGRRNPSCTLMPS